MPLFGVREYQIKWNAFPLALTQMGDLGGEMSLPCLPAPRCIPFQPSVPPLFLYSHHFVSSHSLDGDALFMSWRVPHASIPSPYDAVLTTFRT